MGTNKYGEAAIQATKLYTSKLVNSPQDAWEQATKNIFGEETSSQKRDVQKVHSWGYAKKVWSKEYSGVNLQILQRIRIMLFLQWLFCGTIRHSLRIQSHFGRVFFEA